MVRDYSTTAGSKSYYGKNYVRMKRVKIKFCSKCKARHSTFIGSQVIGWEKDVGIIYDHSKQVRRFKVLVLVHHKDGDPYNDSPENLEYLCDKCHSVVHRNILPKELESKARLARESEKDPRCRISRFFDGKSSLSVKEVSLKSGVDLVFTKKFVKNLFSRRILKRQKVRGRFLYGVNV